MRKLQLLSLLFITTIILVSCKQTKKDEAKEEVIATTYTIDKDSTTIGWVAYKTTSKVPVKGSFTAFNINETTKGTNPKEILDGLKFSIPVGSLHTNDTIRDGKLLKFFFGSLENTAEITGILHMNDDQSGSAEISMNGISQTIPVTYLVNNQTINIESTLDLKNWKAQAAIEALNVVCLDLHKGEDGISKTWDDVKIEVVIKLKQE